MWSSSANVSKLATLSGRVGLEVAAESQRAHSGFNYKCRSSLIVFPERTSAGSRERWGSGVDPAVGIPDWVPDAMVRTLRRRGYRPTWLPGPRFLDDGWLSDLIWSSLDGAHHRLASTTLRDDAPAVGTAESGAGAATCGSRRGRPRLPCY